MTAMCQVRGSGVARATGWRLWELPARFGNGENQTRRRSWGQEALCPGGRRAWFGVAHLTSASLLPQSLVGCLSELTQSKWTGFHFFPFHQFIDNFTQSWTVFYTMLFYMTISIWLLWELESDSELSFDFSKEHLCSAHYSQVNLLSGPLFNQSWLGSTYICDKRVNIFQFL